MSDPLATYLHDHLAGAAAAIDLLETLRDQHAGEPLGRFAEELLTEVKADRAVLEGLAERVGAEAVTPKEAAAWLGGKASRLLIRRRAAGGLGTLRALEALVLGIHGKLALWRALAVVAAEEPRLRGVDFAHLAARARSQHDRVEERRLEAARTALRAAPE